MTSSKPLSLRKTVLISLGIAIIPIFLAALSLYTHYKWEAATQEKLAELNARDSPITPEELNRRYHQHGLDPIENALPIYNRAFEKLSDKPIDFPNVFQHGSDLQPIDAEILLEMSEVLSENEAALPLLKEASTFPFLRNDIDFKDGFLLRLPHVGKHRHGARLLSVEGVLAATTDDRARAEEALIALFQNAVHLADEPLLIPLLATIAIENIGLITLERILSETDLTFETIALLEEQLLTLEQRQRLKNALQGELVNGIGLYQRLSSDAQFRNSLLEDIPAVFGLRFYQLSGLMAKDRFGYLEMMADYIDLAELSPSRILQIGLPTEASSFNPLKGEMLQPVMVPSINRIFKVSIRSTTFLRAAQIALAAERFRLATGQFPEDLNELVPDYLEKLPIDPFNPAGNFEWIRENSLYFVRSQGSFESSGKIIQIEFRLRDSTYTNDSNR